MKKNKLYSFTMKTSRILQVITVVAAILCLLATVIVAVFLSDEMINIIKENILSGNLSIQETGIDFASFSNMKTAGVLGCLYGFVACVLASIVFGNIHRVFKNIEDAKTPFTKENVKLIKQIGMISVLTPVFEIVLSIIIAIVARNNNISVSVNVTHLFMGFVALCLSQFFEYGVKLEDEVEGLL